MRSRCSVTAGTVVADVSISPPLNVGNKRNREPKTSSVGEKFVVVLTELFICKLCLNMNQMVHLAVCLPSIHAVA